MNVKHLAGAALVAAVLLAGCAGNFDVRQTEPLRIQLEQVDVDGPSKRVTVDADGGSREVKVVTKPEHTDVDITVTAVAKASSTVIVGGNQTGNQTNGTQGTSPTVIVIIKDDDTDQELGRDQIQVSNQSASTTINVDVRGHNNVVVVTQAQGGAVDVDVAAKSKGGTSGTGGDGGNTTGYGP